MRMCLLFSCTRDEEIHKIRSCGADRWFGKIVSTSFSTRAPNEHLNKNLETLIGTQPELIKLRFWAVHANSSISAFLKIQENDVTYILSFRLCIYTSRPRQKSDSSVANIFSRSRLAGSLRPPSGKLHFTYWAYISEHYLDSREI